MYKYIYFWQDSMPHSYRSEMPSFATCGNRDTRVKPLVESFPAGLGAAPWCLLPPSEVSPPSRSSPHWRSWGTICTRSPASFEPRLQFNTRSATYPGLWFKGLLSIGKLLSQPRTFQPNPAISEESRLTKPCRQNKGAEPEQPARYPPVESSSLGYCIWTARSETRCSAVKYFLFGSSQSCSKGTCEIHSWVILEWSGPDGSSQMWPNSS